MNVRHCVIFCSHLSEKSVRSYECCFVVDILVLGIVWCWIDFGKPARLVICTLSDKESKQLTHRPSIAFKMGIFGMGISCILVITASQFPHLC